MNTKIQPPTSVKVLTDEMPLTLQAQHVSDYSAYQILSLTSLPLTVTDHQTTVGLAAETWNCSPDGLQYNFKLRDGLKWSDGVPLKPTDYVRAVEFLCKSPALRFSRILSDLSSSGDAILAGASEIQFTLKQPNHFFPQLLSLICFSPLRSDTNSASSGAYKIEDASPTQVRLSLNSFFKPTSAATVQEIEFHRTQADAYFGIERVLRNEFQRSCDTAYPYDRYQELSERTSRRRRQMAMVLSFGNRKAELQDATYRKVFSAIDKLKISQALHGLITPIESYLDLFGMPSDSQPSAQEVADHFPCLLTVAYEDYYPNLQVLELISDQLSKFGVSLLPIKEAYGTRSANCHLRLEIRQSPIPSPYLFYRSEVSQKTFADLSDPVIKRARKLFSEFQITGSEDCLRELDTIVQARGRSFPLFEIPGLYIQSALLAEDNDFVPGETWKLLCYN